MTEPIEVHPSLQDLGAYLQGMATVQLERDRLRLAHEAEQAEANRQLRREEALQQAKVQEAAQARSDAQAADQRQQHQAQALEQLRLLRLRHAHLLDQVPAVRDELDGLLAAPGGTDAQQVLAEVKKELEHLPKFLDHLAKVEQAGMTPAQRVPLLPKGLFQVGVAVQAAAQWVQRMPQRGVSRFVKIGADGAHLPPIADHWVAVLDTANNLIWEVKTERGSHSLARTFTNFGDGREGDSSAYVAEVNRERFAGATDWRMPTVDDLSQLFRATNDMENGWGIRKEGWFWSSSAASREGAKGIDFDRNTRNDRLRSDRYAVRLVRVGQ